MHNLDVVCFLGMRRYNCPYVGFDTRDESPPPVDAWKRNIAKTPTTNTGCALQNPTAGMEEAYTVRFCARPTMGWNGRIGAGTFLCVS